jgi:hypothetical protein
LQQTNPRSNNFFPGEFLESVSCGREEVKALGKINILVEENFSVHELANFRLVAVHLPYQTVVSFDDNVLTGFVKFVVLVGRTRPVTVPLLFRVLLQQSLRLDPHHRDRQFVIQQSTPGTAVPLLRLLQPFEFLLAMLQHLLQDLLIGSMKPFPNNFVEEDRDIIRQIVPLSQLLFGILMSGDPGFLLALFLRIFLLMH